MVVGALILLLGSLAMLLPAVLGTKRTDQELDQLEARGDRDAWSFRSLEEHRRISVDLGRFMVPVSIVLLIRALLESALR